MHKIIFTDLDGTLTLKDTYTKFLFRHISLNRIVLNIHILVKVFILYLFGRKDGNDVKRETFKVFFAKKNIKELNQDIGSFIHSISWNNPVLDLIKKEQFKNGTKVIIVTASPNIYIKDICDYLDYDGYISTSVELENDILTGRIIGKVCNFDEKVRKIKNFLNGKDCYKISYGNSKGDYAMLNYCDKSYFVKKNTISNFK